MSPRFTAGGEWDNGLMKMGPILEKNWEEKDRQEVTAEYIRYKTSYNEHCFLFTQQFMR